MLWISSLNINKIKHFEQIVTRWVTKSYMYEVFYLNCLVVTEIGFVIQNHIIKNEIL